MTNTNADGSVENPTVEDLQAQLAAANEAKAKAEAKIVDLKKSNTPSDEPVKKEEANVAEPKTTEETLKEAVAAGIEAYKQEQANSNAEANQAATNNASVGWEAAPINWFTPITASKFDTLSSDAKESYMKESMSNNSDEVVFA